MKEREYHLKFKGMEKLLLGRQVVETIDATRKKTMFVYEVFAAVITMLGLNDLGGEDTVKGINEWVEETLYQRQSQARTKVIREKSEIPEPGGISPAPKTVSGEPNSLSMFTGNSKLSDITGGIV